MREVIVSVIIPVFNQESYIEECLLSILHQTFEWFELIIIDNNSVDKSVEICREFARQDERIVLAKEKKQGVSYARNKGLNLAKGEYIVFIDPDDTVEENYLSELIGNISPSIMPVCEVNKQYEDKNEIQKIKAEKQAISKYEKFEAPGIEGYPVNKLYETKIIRDNNIYFDTEAFVQEDLLFNYNYVKYIKDLKIINEALYNYRMRKGSAIRGKEDIKTLLKIEEFCKKEKISTEKIEYSIIRAYLINKDKNKDYRDRFKKYLTNWNYPTKQKIKLTARALLGLDKKAKYELYE